MSTSISLTLKTTILRCDCTQRETNEWKTWVLISRDANLKPKKLHAESIKGKRSEYSLIRKGKKDKFHAVDSVLTLIKDKCENINKMR